jgi:hypothetical protein
MARKTLKKSTAVAFFMIGLRPSAALGAETTVQASSYLVSYDLANDPITPANSILNGLDCSGEWVLYRLPALPFGTYHVTMKCWGDAGVPYHLELVTMPVQGEQPTTISLDFTGLGTSCT